MKHIEQIKSFVLFLLVILSLILTFSIWTYTPDYQPIKDSQVEPITVGQQKELHEVLKPYRILAHDNGKLLGTIQSTQIDRIMNTLTDLSASNLIFMQSNLSEEEINSAIHTDNRMTLFFSYEVPMETFLSVLEFSQNDLPETTFSHLIIDWSEFSQTNSIQFLFISEENRTLYRTDVALSKNNFENTFMEVVNYTEPYSEIERTNNFSLYVPTEKVEIPKFTYSINQVSPDKFKNILFKDSNIVQKNIESNTSTKYTDGMAAMTSDASTRTINFVYPASESIGEMKPSVLFQNSFDFVNDHGGLTGDYRYVYSNVLKHVTEYQLFAHDLPVFSQVTSTRIVTTWGDNQIFQYKRPSFILDTPFDISNQQLPSGVEVAEALPSIEDINEIVLGYYLSQEEKNYNFVYTLIPSWFTINKDGSWTRLTTETMGGAEYGLE
ncbi:two-component system activity regulator YycH [Lysinibacillus halotolerans]|uniref:YycH family regulatory protein n=1 Tax=Bacillales TaxID=1385 RepID=UPI0013141796|nr:two-component system activity regulator YycH [Lysinibacillus halotolerans]